MYGLQRSAAIWAVVLIAVGAIFVGQGLGLIRSRSFMTDDSRWAIIGGALLVAGLLVVVRRRVGP